MVSASGINSHEIGLALSCNDRQFARIRRVLYAYPVMWGVGFGGLYWPILLLICASNMTYDRSRRTQWTSIVFVIAALACSALVGSVQFGFDPTRILGLAGNISVWLCILLLLNLSRFQADVKIIIAKSFVILALFQGALTLVAQTIYPARVPLPLLQSFAPGMPSGVAAFAYDKLYYYDWLGGAAFRSAGVMANPTWAGAVAAVAIFAAVYVFKENRTWKFLSLISVMAAIYSIDMSLSRSVLYAVIGAAAVTIIEAIRQRQPMVGYWLWTVCGVSVTLLLSIWWGSVVEWVDSVNGERAGSLQSRGEIYSRTWAYIKDLPVPILGFGVKPQEDNLAASIASHSTYLGLLFRGGMIGLAAFIVFLAKSARVVIGRGDPVAVGILSFVAIWCILEDFDAGHLLPMAVLMAVCASHAELQTRACQMESSAVERQKK